MKVTNVNLKKVEEKGAVKGYATIILDDSLAIHNIRLIESKDKMFIAFPSQKGNDGKYYDSTLGVLEEYDMSKLLGYLEIKC